MKHVVRWATHAEITKAVARSPYHFPPDIIQIKGGYKGLPAAVEAATKKPFFTTDEGDDFSFSYAQGTPNNQGLVPALVSGKTLGIPEARLGGLPCVRHFMVSPEVRRKTGVRRVFYVPSV